MRLGNYRDKIKLQRPAFTENSIGERVPGWADVAEVWASVLPVGPGEASTRYSIRMHYRPDVESTWRAIYRGRPLEFISVADVYNRRQELEAVTVEHQGSVQ